MKYPALLLLASLGCAPGIDLQAAEIAEISEPGEKEKTLLTAAQLDELLAPIALYPDPLVAIILPASTFPAEIVLAVRYLKANGDPEAIDNQPWDDSVKALARYPEVVKWMDENLAWTQQVGAAFTVQPAAVLTGTQRLRAAAVAAGNLKDTPQQTVVVEKEVIRIVPAEREVIYVPVYDPVWVYRPRPVHVHYPTPLVTFSIGYRTGVWLSYGCDWGYKTVVVVNRPYRPVIWQSYPVCHYPRPVIVEHCRPWRPAPARVQIVRRDYERRADYRVARPAPNSHVQRGPERPSPPRAVASSGSATPSPRPAERRDVAAAPAPAPAPASSARAVPTPAARATSPIPTRDVRNPAVISTRDATPSLSRPTSTPAPAPAASKPRPANPAPAVVRNEATSRPAPAQRPENISRPVATAPATPRPERIRPAAPVKPAAAPVASAPASTRPERVRPAPAASAPASRPYPSSSPGRPATSPSAPTATLAETDFQAIRAR